MGCYAIERDLTVDLVELSLYALLCPANSFSVSYAALLIRGSLSYSLETFNDQTSQALLTGRTIYAAAQAFKARAADSFSIIRVSLQAHVTLTGLYPLNFLVSLTLVSLQATRDHSHQFVFLQAASLAYKSTFKTSN